MFDSPAFKAAPVKRPRKGFNRWFGLALAFVVAPLVTLVAAGGYIDGSVRSGPYAGERADIQAAIVASSDYHSKRSGSFCTVTLATGLVQRSADVEDSTCFKKISAGDHVTFRLWRGDVTNIWDGSYSLWTQHNPAYQVHEWLPLMVFCSAGTVALMGWSVWNFRRNRPPPRQPSLPMQ